MILAPTAPNAAARTFSGAAGATVSQGQGDGAFSRLLSGAAQSAPANPSSTTGSTPPASTVEAADATTNTTVPTAAPSAPEASAVIAAEPAPDTAAQATRLDVSRPPVRGKPACRAPTPISLRAGEASESELVESTAPAQVSPALTAREAPVAKPPTSATPDPAASVLLQIQSAWSPASSPPPAPHTAAVSTPPVLAGVEPGVAAAAAGPVPALPVDPSKPADPAPSAASLEPVPLATPPQDAAPLLIEDHGAGSGPPPVPAPTSGASAVAPRMEFAPPAPAVVNTARPDWPEQLSGQISWQLGQEVQEARIALAPDDLGAIDVQVRVQEGRVQVHMAAAQPATRELLSEALPRLRELLGDSGLSLSQASVFNQDAQSRGHSSPFWRGETAAGEPERDRAEAPAVLAPRRTRGLFDHYA